MEKAKIDRINELAHIAKVRPLTNEEAAERHQLRQEYLEDFRKSFRQQLERIEFVDGPEKPLS
ncbi:MAG: DUF896 domain-containing protein [Mogibacterium sp.]|nr:DUF896 domain-containing protein [Mogibacterium sp.]